MTGTSEPGDLYELLGVARDAAAAEITRAYHRRARALHPDAQPGQAGEPAGFREVEEAYRVLHDPARRAAYDQALRPPAAPPAARPASGPPGADWPGPPGWAAVRPPGATLWAGPVRVIPPAGCSPGADTAGAWPAAWAADPDDMPRWEWWLW